MKKILLSSLAFVSFWSCLFGQNQPTNQPTNRKFYVARKPNSPELTLTSLTNNLQMNNVGVVNNNLSIRKAFMGTNSELLKRTYIVEITTNDSNVLDNFSNYLKNINTIDLVEEIPEYESLHEPNDIDILSQSRNNLDLVRAPLAWEITKGVNTVKVGVSDSGFNINHEDLSENIIEHTGSIINKGGHGTAVSGYISAVTNNNQGIASIGYNTKLITYNSQTAEAVYLLAQKENVRVINMSWGGCRTASDIEAEVYREIVEDMGVVLVVAGGNGAGSNGCSTSSQYVYPASYDHMIAVSSVGSNFNIGESWYNPNSNTYHKIEWNDVHLVDVESNISHQHNDKIDIVAPGYGLVGISNSKNADDSIYGKGSGTSYAAPQVAAAAALVLSVKPDLTPAQVKDILLRTADDIYWIPYNQPYIGQLGSGRLNVFRAVKETQCMNEQNPTLDLMIRDSREDVGEEPNSRTEHMWTSNDIFVRNQNDGKLTPVHQNPEYKNNGQNYIYVRVTNNSCKTSSGTDTVTVNWAKAATSLNYPQYWDGSIVRNGVPFGGLVGTGVVPVLKPGQEALVEIPWNVPNPKDYENINSDPWHFCLLAEINSTEDLLTSPKTSNPNFMVRNNNNLAWKNITVVNVADDKEKIGGVVAVHNPYSSLKKYRLELVKEEIETGKAIYEEAEVGIQLDNTLLSAWIRGGKTAVKIAETNLENKKIATDNHVMLDNISMNPNETGTVYLSFNFLTKELTDKEKYRYHVIQKDTETGEIMGGETYEIIKKPRPVFSANVSNLGSEIPKNQPTTIEAEDIQEDAIYNWYNEDGTLLYTGKNITVQQQNTQTYTLEVIANDGFKDYKNVEVKVKPYNFISISPNPASNQITLNYDIENADLAYIRIQGLTTNVLNNYVLDNSSNSTTINIQNLSAGQYVVSLIADGEVIASKNLIKN